MGICSAAAKNTLVGNVIQTAGVSHHNNLAFEQVSQQCSPAWPSWWWVSCCTVCLLELSHSCTVMHTSHEARCTLTSSEECPLSEIRTPSESTSLWCWPRSLQSPTWALEHFDLSISNKTWTRKANDGKKRTNSNVFAFFMKKSRRDLLQEESLAAGHFRQEAQVLWWWWFGWQPWFFRVEGLQLWWHGQPQMDNDT